MGRRRRLALCSWAVLVMTIATPLAQLASDDLKSFDGTWEGQLHVYRLSVTDGASQLVGQSEEVRLQIRRVPFELKKKNARGEWEDQNSSTLFSFFKFEAAAGTLLGRFLRSGADQDGRWVEHQTFYITRKDRSTVVVYWLRAVNNLDLGLTNPDSKFGFLRAGELSKIP